MIVGTGPSHFISLAPGVSSESGFGCRRPEAYALQLPGPINIHT